MDERLEILLKKLGDMIDDHLRVMQRCLSADDHNLFITNLLAGAAINRSLSNVRGFSAMMKIDNYLLAGSIVRLQLDTLLRFYALHLVKKPQDLASDILSGKKIRKMKSKDDNFLTDAYLCEKFAETEKLPWVRIVYERTSGLIHLSRSHIVITLQSQQDDSEQMFRLAIGEKTMFVSYDDQEELIECMIHITQLIITYVLGWVKTKESFSVKRMPEAI